MANEDTSEEESTLGKRNAVEDPAAEDLVEHSNKALVVFSSASTSQKQVLAGTPKKRKISGTERGQPSQVGEEATDQAMLDVAHSMEAVGHGAADELTEPLALRQEQ